MSFLRASYRIELTLIDAAVVPFDLFQVTGDSPKQMLDVPGDAENGLPIVESLQKPAGRRL